MEKEIWKWILEAFTDEGIANFALNYGIKIPGFRQINPQHKNFKIVRQRIIQDALHQRNAQKLTDFFNSIEDEQGKLETIKGKSTEELLQLVEEEIHPSILFGVLLSSEDVEDRARAQEIYIKLIEEEKLDLLESQADGKLEKAENMNEVQEDTLKKLQEEMKSAQKIIDKLEKRLKKFEQKNEELKLKEAQAQLAHKNEKKQWKEDKKELLKELNVHKGELGSLKHTVTVLSSEKESLQKRVEKQTASLKLKDDEIKRLNALVLTLKTDNQKRKDSKEMEAEGQGNPTSITNNKIKVAMIGDPKNSRLLKYNKFELTVLETTEIKEEKINKVLDTSDQVWLLTYKTPRTIQKRVRSIVKEKQVQEFATFIELENYMLKGMI